MTFGTMQSVEFALKMFEAGFSREEFHRLLVWMGYISYWEDGDQRELVTEEGRILMEAYDIVSIKEFPGEAK